MTNGTGNSNIVIDHCTVGWNGSSGIGISGTGNNNYVGHSTAYNNAWGGNWTQDITFNTGTGIRMFGNGAMSNNIFEYDTVYNNGLGPTGIWNTQGVNQSPPDYEDGGGIMLDTMGTDNIMRYCTAYNNEVAGLRVVVDTGTQVYGCISYGNVQTIELANYSGMGIDLDFGISGTQVYNCTFYGNQINVLVQGNTSNPVKLVTNLNFHDNIAAAAIAFELYAIIGGNNDGVNGSGNVYTYNAFGVQAASFITWSFGVTFSTYPSWEAATGNCGTTGCSHSLESAVSFANAGTGDFRLVPGSPALTAGSTGGYIGALGIGGSKINGGMKINGLIPVQ
jgi:hypothetical protein